MDGNPLITAVKVHYKVKVPKGKREEALRGIAIEWDGEVAEE